MRPMKSDRLAQKKRPPILKILKRAVKPAAIEAIAVNWDLSKSTNFVSTPIKVPPNIIFLVPYLSISLPIIGALNPNATTRGMTIKLACDVESARIVTANAGRNTIAVWFNPVPNAMLVAILTSRLLSRAISIIGSSAIFSIFTSTGSKITAAIKNGQV